MQEPKNSEVISKEEEKNRLSVSSLCYHLLFHYK